MATMKYSEFVALVSRMRKQQRDYFASRSSTALRNAMQLEREVDKAISDYSQTQLQFNF